MSKFVINKLNEKEINTQLLKMKKQLDYNSQQATLAVSNLSTYATILSGNVLSLQNYISQLAYYITYLREILKRSSKNNSGTPISSWGQYYDTISIADSQSFGECEYCRSKSYTNVGSPFGTNKLNVAYATIEGVNYYFDKIDTKWTDTDGNVIASPEVGQSNYKYAYYSKSLLIGDKDPDSDSRWFPSIWKPRLQMWDDNGNAPRWMCRDEGDRIIAWQKAQGIYPVVG